MEEKNYLGITIKIIGELMTIGGLILLIVTFLNITDEEVGTKIFGFIGLIPSAMIFLSGILIKGFGEIINILHSIKNNFEIINQQKKSWSSWFFI